INISRELDRAILDKPLTCCAGDSMKQLFRFIGLIFKGIWKVITFIRLALTNLIFLLSLAIIYFVYIHAESPTPTVDKASALVLNLSGPIVEQSTYVNPMDSFAGSVLGQD